VLEVAKPAITSRVASVDADSDVLAGWVPPLTVAAEMVSAHQVSEVQEGCEKTHVLYQGTTLQLAEKLPFLKGTAFSP
jgi:hypothetical protein